MFDTSKGIHDQIKIRRVMIIMMILMLKKVDLPM